MIARFLLVAALVAGALATFAGGLAPVYPPADFANHMRPYFLAATGAMLLAALALRARRTAWSSAALAGINVLLLALPLLWSAGTTGSRAVGQALAAPGQRDLKIVTFNMHYGNVRATARFLLEQDADIVVLQEIGAAQMRALRPLLQAKYPHSHSCSIRHRCDAAVFAKRPWAAAGQEAFSDDGPEIVWAQFNDRELGKLRVVGVHAALPFTPWKQVRHVNRLIALRAAHKGPLIVAGDLNMTPWSYHQLRFLARADMRRHATFLRSWPTDGQFLAPFPAFLIDHVMTTPDIGSVSIGIGPNLGSDHLPVVAVLRLPPA